MGDSDGEEDNIEGIDLEDVEFEDVDPRDFELGEDHIDITLESIIYPSVSDIKSIHDDIVHEDEDASKGELNIGSVDFALEYIEHGHFGEVPESVDGKAFHLMRLLAANHGFADGNKRTALNTTWTFYAINGYYFDYGEEIKAILKLLAVKEEMVDGNEVISYFSDIRYDMDDDRSPTELVKLQHLFHWKDDIEQRFAETKELESDQKGEQIAKLLMEMVEVTSALVAYKNEYSDTIPGEIILVIDEMSEDITDFLDFLGEARDLINECDSRTEYDKRIEKLLNDHPFVASEE